MRDIFKVEVFEFDVDMPLTPKQVNELEDQIDRAVAEKYGDGYMVADYQLRIAVLAKRGVRRLPRKGGE